MRLTLYAGPPLQSLLADREGQPPSRIVNTALDRYQQLLRAALPRLAEEEWLCLADLANGLLLDDWTTVTLLWASVEDAGRLAALDEKWRVDTRALATQMRAWDRATLVSVVDVLERLWARPGEDFRARLRTLLDGTTGALPPPQDRAALGEIETPEASPLTDDQAEALVRAIRASDRVTYDGLCAAWGVTNGPETWTATRARLGLGA